MVLLLGPQSSFLLTSSKFCVLDLYLLNSYRLSMFVDTSLFTKNECADFFADHVQENLKAIMNRVAI